MIKANELRIGNLISDPECDPFYFEVEQLSKYVGTDIWIKYRNSSIKAKEVHGLTLTEEWLTKFVFVREYGYGIMWERKDLCISIRQEDKIFKIIPQAPQIDDWGNIDTGYNEKHLREIKYIHEIQNIYFSLTGKELQITQL